MGSMMGLMGILAGLGLLIWLAYRGWSVLLLTPLAAMLAAAFAFEPLLADWTQTFMAGAAGSIAQFFPNGLHRRRAAGAGGGDRARDAVRLLLSIGRDTNDCAHGMCVCRVLRRAPASMLPPPIACALVISFFPTTTP
ncbi:hypothetical protein [Thiohalocapsa sp.]|jgi:hypothetical protein|uniref:hypothetical protein n=1 Tax=Thiohalocapsa sp. TaxID=2497641 RepID=UPI0025DBA9DF|nr:hypothetical protein [Thiohalocapsa sp.]